MPQDAYTPGYVGEPVSTVLKKEAKDFWVVTPDDWERLKFTYGAIDEIPRFTINDKANLLLEIFLSKLKIVIIPEVGHGTLPWLTP